MSVFFTRGSTFVTLKDPTWPEGAPPAPNQTIGFSVGGAIKVARNGEDETEIRLNFVRVADAQKTALEAFLQSTVTWSAYTFAYRDWNNVTRSNVRYISGFPGWRRTRGGVWSGELVLREDLGT